MLLVLLAVVLASAFLALVFAVRGAQTGYETEEGFFRGEQEIAMMERPLVTDEIADQSSGAKKIARAGLGRARHSRRKSGTDTPFSARK